MASEIRDKEVESKLYRVVFCGSVSSVNGRC
jgi:hypothetical protein